MERVDRWDGKSTHDMGISLLYTYADLVYYMRKEDP